MEPLELFNEYFRAALNAKLSEMGYGSQSALADKIGAARPLINSYLKGARNISEDRKKLIAKTLGTTYEEMFATGRRMIDGEPAPTHRPENHATPIKRSAAPQKALDALEKIYNAGDLAAIQAIEGPLFFTSSRLDADPGHKKKSPKDPPQPEKRKTPRPKMTGTGGTDWTI